MSSICTQKIVDIAFWICNRQKEKGFVLNNQQNSCCCPVTHVIIMHKNYYVIQYQCYFIINQKIDIISNLVMTKEQ